MLIKISIPHSPDFKPLLRASAKALADGINRTLEEGQTAQRQSMARSFIDRRRGFLDKMIKIAPGDRARADRLVGRLRVVGPEGAEDRAKLLTRHEDGGVQTPSGGYSIDPSVRIKGFFWLPTTEIRPQFGSTVPRRLYPANLRMVERQDISGKLPAMVHKTKRGILQLKGKERTFLIIGSGPKADQVVGIFQRKGGKKGRSTGRVTRWGSGTRDDIKLIWAFKRKLTLKPRLHFYQIVPRVVRERIAINYSGMMAAHLRGSVVSRSVR